MNEIKEFLKVFFSPEGRKAQAAAVTSIIGYLVTLGVLGDAQGVPVEQAISALVSTAANAYAVYTALNIPKPLAEAVKATAVVNNN